MWTLLSMNYLDFYCFFHAILKVWGTSVLCKSSNGDSRVIGSNWLILLVFLAIRFDQKIVLLQSWNKFCKYMFLCWVSMLARHDRAFQASWLNDDLRKIWTKVVVTLNQRHSSKESLAIVYSLIKYDSYYSIVFMLSVARSITVKARELQINIFRPVTASTAVHLRHQSNFCNDLQLKEILLNWPSPC